MVGKKVCLLEPQKIGLIEFEVPKIRPDEVLIENEYTTVSAGTERANLLDMPNTAGDYPRDLGYCGVGHIIECGNEVKNAEIGDRTIVYFGGHRNYSILKAADIVNVPEKVRSIDAALVVIAGMGLQGARKTRLELGESAMVIGQGLLGLFATQAMKLMGGIPVIALDFDAKRLELSRRLGADYAFDPREEGIKEKILEVTHGKGVNAIVEVTGSAKALVQALELAAWEGRISLTGCTRVSDMSIDYYKMVHRRGVQLIGAHTFVRPERDSYPGYWTFNDDHRVLLDLIAAGRIQVEPVISQIVSPINAPEVYGHLAENPLAQLGVVFDWMALKKG